MEMERYIICRRGSQHHIVGTMLLGRKDNSNTTKTYGFSCVLLIIQNKRGEVNCHIQKDATEMLAANGGNWTIQM